MPSPNRAAQPAAVALTLLAYALRILAVLMCALTVLLCFSGISAKLNLVSFVVDLTRALPDVISGYGVVATPFGGVFRLDFALCAVVLFLLDYLCCRLAARLRR